MKKTWVRSLVMVAVLLFGAISAQADSLFSPLDIAGEAGKSLRGDLSFKALAEDPATSTLEVVHANSGMVSKEAKSFLLNLATGIDLRAHQVDSYVMKTGSLVWSGVIETPGSVSNGADIDFDAINSVMIVKDGDTLTGNVHFNGTWYQIRPLRSGGHAIVEVDMSLMPAEHPAEYRELPTYPMKNPRRAAQEKADTVIRVMVHWTSSAASASGNISALVDLAVAETNQGYTNSGVLIDLVLARKSLISYTQSGSFSTDLSRYRSSTDSYMTAAHTDRNTYSADVGVLIINNSSACGLASGIGSSATTAFAAVHWSCATGYYSFGHEIGHLQSARHDPATDPSTSPYAYGHGYRQQSVTPRWRTIMAYDCSGGCPRLNYWSSPLRTYNGLVMGTASQSDNARVLNNTRNTIAAFR
ncbi:MAG TPA: M12 family metallo-peptidase [Thermoanaerobaculia bacterium]|nr:M12 family metallo-peptidase [Thermoanaerobaculia bacterium]